MTFEVGLSRSVRAFHVMPGVPGPEGQLHDHDYRIEVVVDREQLDERGMVCDLDALEAALTELTGRVEGRNLEEIRPAGAEAVTVEVFARWVHDTPLACRRCRGRRGAGGAGLGEPRRVWRIPRTLLRRSVRARGRCAEVRIGRLNRRARRVRLHFVGTVDTPFFVIPVGLHYEIGLG